MPWKVSWLDPDESIITYEVDDPWSYKEFVEVVRQGQAMIGSKDYTVDTIYQLPDAFNLPGPNPLTHMRDVYATDPENSGINIIVGAGMLVNTLVNIITSVMGGSSRFIFVPSMAEALAKIEQARAERQRE